MNPLLTIEQVAELLDCSRDTVTGRLARNELPGGPVLRYLVDLSRLRMAYSAKPVRASLGATDQRTHPARSAVTWAALSTPGPPAR